VTALAALVAFLFLAVGYLLGWRFGQRRARNLKSALDEREEVLILREQELLRASSIDPVTGLHMQQHFQEFLESEWRRASRERHAVSVVMIELDHFRVFNTRVGQIDGDACLKRVAGALKPLLQRPGDLLARYGGAGTFGAVLGGTDGPGALALAERFRLAIEGLQIANPASETGHVLTASLGAAATVPARNADWQEIELIAAAERALERIRQSGRNSVALDQAEATARATSP